MRQTRILLASLFSLSLATNAFLAQTLEYSSPKLDEKHVFDSVLPQERVDLFSGALTLSFRDVHLPGPAGLDLDIVRWYNSKINIKDSNCLTSQSEETSLGIGWYIHLGRLFDNNGALSGPKYRLELPGGQQEEFYTQATIAVPPNALVSRNGWILNVGKLIAGLTYHVAVSPAGIEYRFWTGGIKFNNYWYLTTKADPIGNMIQVTYETRLKAGAYPKTVTIDSANPADTFNRTVTFVYATNQIDDPDRLTKIQTQNATGGTVEFLYNVGGTGGQPTLGTSGHQGLLSVTTPLGLTTTFNYDLRTGETSEEVELKQMTLPTGQVLQYFYQDHSFFSPCNSTFQTNECTRVVQQRVVVNVGTWNYTWPSGTSTDDTTVVQDPFQNIERDKFVRYPSSGSPNLWKIGLLLHRETQDATSGLLRSEDFTYSSKEISSRNVSPSSLCSETVQTPRVDVHSVTPRSGGSSKTSRTLLSNYDDYGNPGIIKENNFLDSLIRQQELTYAHGTGGQWTPTVTYIVDRPARITVKDSDGSTIRKDTKYTYYATKISPGSPGQLQREEHWVDKLGDFASANKWLATDYDYDAGGDLSHRIMRSTSGDRTTTLVHAYGSLQSLSDQEGTIFTRQISQYTGAVTSQTDPNFKTTSFLYDNQGRLTTVTPPIDSQTTIVYDNATAKSATVTQGISETRYEYDGLGRPVLTRRLLSSGLYTYNRVLYDAVGNILKSYEADFSDPSGSAPAVVKTYDALGRPKTQQDPFGTTAFSYGTDSTTITYPVSGTKTLTYDALGRIITVLDERNFTTTYAFDPNDILKTVVHPGSVSSRVFTNNTLGQTVREDLPESGATRREFNDFGEVDRQDDADNRSLTMTYDFRGRRKTAVETGGDTTTWFYDGDSIPGCATCLSSYTNPLGNLTGMSNSAATIQWADRDALNRILSRRTVLEGSTFVEGYGYDTRGNLNHRTYPILNGAANRAVVDLTLNQGNKATTLMLNASTTVASNITYNAAFGLKDIPLGNVVTIQRPTSPSLTNLPDLIQTVGVLNQSGVASNLTLDYGYDARGRVGSITTNGRLDTYNYTPRNELNSVSYSGQGGVTFSYDATGNITQQSSAAFPQLNFTRTYSNNRIDAMNYYFAGLQKGDGISTYDYDKGGRLSLATTPSGVYTFKYDGDARRRTTQKPDASKELTFYSETGDLLSKFSLPVGGSPVAVEDAIYLEGERIATRRYPELSDPGNTLLTDIVGSDVTLAWGAPVCTNKINVTRATVKQFTDGTTIASTVNTQTYTDAGEGTVQANKFYLIAGPKPSLHYHVNDHLGSTRLVVDENRRVEASYEYFPFGMMKAESCSHLNAGFTSKERDAGSGLDYFGARYYSSSMGRWISPDTGRISPAHLESPQKWNKYNYVLNNPLMMIDPDGQVEVTVVYRAFIPQSNVAYIGPGDNRSFSTQANASSRITITIRIETDPAKNHGNPVIGEVGVQISSTHNNLTGNDTPAVVVQAPTVKPSQDANGNVILNVQMNVHSGDMPAALSIRSDVNIGVNGTATQGSVRGKVSGSPAFEVNFTPQGAPTTNLPIQGAASNAVVFTRNLARTNSVDKKTQIQEAPKQ